MPANKVVTINVKRRGRPAGPSAVKSERFAMLDKLHGDKSNRVTLALTSDDKVTEVPDAIPTALLKLPADYTGTVGLIGEWAKSKGHKVRTYNGGNYFVVNKATK